VVRDLANASHSYEQKWICDILKARKRHGMHCAFGDELNTLPELRPLHDSSPCTILSILVVRCPPILTCGGTVPSFKTIRRLLKGYQDKHKEEDGNAGLPK
jgi:hypothetical protein